jgi:hypothetical protein
MDIYFVLHELVCNNVPKIPYFLQDEKHLGAMHEKAEDLEKLEESPTEDKKSKILNLSN